MLFFQSTQYWPRLIPLTLLYFSFNHRVATVVTYWLKMYILHNLCPLIKRTCLNLQLHKVLLNVNWFIFIHAQWRQLTKSVWKRLSASAPLHLSLLACGISTVIILHLLLLLLMLSLSSNTVTPWAATADSPLQHQLVVSPHASTCCCLPLYAQQHSLT